MGMIYGTIICLGDSLTHGARDDFWRCYPMELSDYFAEHVKQRWICAEEGVNGETSADVLRRTLGVVKRYPEAYEVVLCVGMNDTKDNVATPMNMFEKNLRGIIRILEVYGKSLVLCTIPDLRGFGAPDYTQNSVERLAKYNQIVCAIAEEKAYPLVELRGLPNECYADGVHFTNFGNIEVARRVGEVIVAKRSFK